MKIVLLALTCIMISLAACKNESKKEGSKNATEKIKTPEDSVMAEVMDGHDVGMAKMGRLDAMQKDVQRILDSIGKLPAKAKVKLEPYRASMENVLEDLKTAKAGMEKWMSEFDMDSARNDVDKRLRYLKDENGKVTAVKRNILFSLGKADSLIKAKF